MPRTIMRQPDVHHLDVLHLDEPRAGSRSDARRARLPRSHARALTPQRQRGRPHHDTAERRHGTSIAPRRLPLRIVRGEWREAAMAKSGETGNTRKPATSKKAGAKAAARNTAGGPGAHGARSGRRRAGGEGSGHRGARRGDAVQREQAAEIGRDNAHRIRRRARRSSRRSDAVGGEHAEREQRLATRPAAARAPGVNPTVRSLDRVRVDAGGQRADHQPGRADRATTRTR